MSIYSLYWKGDTIPKNKFVIYSEWGRDEYNFDIEDISYISPKSFPIIKKEPVPDWWVEKVESIKERIHRREIDKEVIYRKIVLPTYSIHPYEILKGLEHKVGTHFAFKLTPKGKILFGITPEKVLEKKKTQIEIEVLGGTKINGETDWDIAKVEEHNIIVSDLVNKLNKSSFEGVNFTSADSKYIGYTSHLQTKIRAITDKNTNEIISIIHPNLAIKGDEKGREYFGGLIGWETQSEAHFYLTIRCGVWDGNSYTFWVGCGITKYSDAEREWEETYQKLKWLEPK